MRLVLDTNIYCDFAEGLPDVVATIAEYGEEIFIPAIVIAELTYGFMKGNRQVANESKLKHVIEQLGIEIIDVNKDVARKYALVYLHLVNKGRKIPINDVWIAACCEHVGGTLLSRDKHFDEIGFLDRFPLS
jgi:predicted nucleic acid-binding protein